VSSFHLKKFATAGYACQADLRSQALEKGMPETAPFHLIGTADGRKYMYGDALNNALAGSQYSVWAVAGGAAQHAGCTALPDVEEMFGYVTEVLGSDKFGLPRVPENNQPNYIPIDCVTALWPALQPIVKRFCPNSSDWPILYSLAIQEIIYMGKDTVDPCLALKIVMESAIAMSKIDRPLGRESAADASLTYSVGADD